MRVYIASALTTIDKDCIAEDIAHGMDAVDVAHGHARAVSDNPDKAFDAALLAVCQDIAAAVNAENPDGVQVDPVALSTHAEIEELPGTLGEGGEFWVTIKPDYVVAVVVTAHDLI